MFSETGRREQESESKKTSPGQDIVRNRVLLVANENKSLFDENKKKTEMKNFLRAMESWERCTVYCIGYLYIFFIFKIVREVIIGIVRTIQNIISITLLLLALQYFCALCTCVSLKSLHQAFLACWFVFLNFKRDICSNSFICYNVRWDDRIINPRQ